jgi:hypothetical protein
VPVQLDAESHSVCAGLLSEWIHRAVAVTAGAIAFAVGHQEDQMTYQVRLGKFRSPTAIREREWEEVGTALITGTIRQGR